MDFEKIARDDYDPSEYESPEAALLEEVGKFIAASHARGMSDYFGMGKKEGEGEEGGEECPDCAEGTCMKHMDPQEAEKMAAMSME